MRRIKEPVDLVIYNCRIASPKAITEGGVAIDNEKIVEIAKTPNLPSANNKVDGKGNLLIPGVIDAHAHIHDENYLHHEDFYTGTMAAAYGGVTSIVEMTLESPIVEPHQIRNKIRVGENNSFIDFTLHASNMREEYIPLVPEISKLGLNSFKGFLCDPYYLTSDQFTSLMRTISRVGGVQVVHAEDQTIVKRETEKLQKAEKNLPIDYPDSRPAKAEQIAIQTIAKIAHETNCRLHIAHLSSKLGLQAVKEAKQRGVKLTVETAPHYLLLTRQNIEHQGPYLKMNPPLREKEDNNALWKGIQDGSVDIIISEHAPGTREEKEIGWTNIWEAWGGIPQIETMLPLILSEGVNKNKITIQKMVQVMCESPARIFGLYPRKGVIQHGADADLVLVDLKKRQTIRSNILHHKCIGTPFEGHQVKGWPYSTLVRGTFVIREGELQLKPGYGKFQKTHPVL